MAHSTAIIITMTFLFKVILVIEGFLKYFFSIVVSARMEFLG